MRMALFLLVACFLLGTTTAAFTEQQFALNVGSVIPGQHLFGGMGAVIDTSPDARTVLSSSSMLSDRTIPGFVQVHVWNDGAGDWVQKGSTIDGVVRQNFGTSLDLSDDGLSFIVGAPRSPTGHAVVYRWDSNSQDWSQVGMPLLGPNTKYHRFGYAVAMSGDGLTVAGATEMTGRIHTYKYDSASDDWVETSAINFSGEWFAEVALSTDGSILAIGSPEYDSPGAGQSGRVHVYQWDGSVWGKMGQNIVGKIGDKFGHTFALSADGLTVVAGSKTSSMNPPRAEVYTWNGISGQWDQKGRDLLAPSRYTAMKGLELSPDGNSVAMVTENSVSSQPGQIHTWTWGSTDWEDGARILQWNYQTNPPYTYTSPVGSLYGDLAFSADGSILIIGQERGVGGNGGVWTVYFGDNVLDAFPPLGFVLGVTADDTQLKCQGDVCEELSDGVWVSSDSSPADIVSGKLILTEEFQAYGSNGDMVRMDSNGVYIVKQANGVISTYRSLC